MRTPIRRTVVALATAAVLTLGSVAAYADLTPAPSAPGYPTWSDVQAARGSVAATDAEVSVVRAALQRAQSAAQAASNAAITAQQAAQQADAALQAATTRADTLSTAAKAAESAAARDTNTAGGLAATLYRTQADSMMVMQLLTSHDGDHLLQRLSVLDDVTGWWNTATKDAQSAQAVAASLRDNARTAEIARGKLSANAHAASAAADSASQRADAAASAAQAHTDVLYAQLATLQKSTAAVERRYTIGVQVAAQAAAEERAREAAARREAALEQAARERSQAAASAAQAAAGAGWTPSPGAGSMSPAAAQAYARGAIGAYGWGSGQFSCLVSLWDMESGWQWNALNPSSDAYGIPQSLPAYKMAVAGPDWRTSASTQIDWGLAYISSAYGTPCGAWNHEMSVYPHWY